MLLYFADSTSLTGARIIPGPLILIYPTTYNLVLECVTGPYQNTPVNIEEYKCDEWHLQIKSGYNTAAKALINKSYTATCVQNNIFTLPVETSNVAVYKTVAGRYKTPAVFTLKGYKQEGARKRTVVAIQFNMFLQSSGTNVEPPEPSISGTTNYTELTNLPSINNKIIRNDNPAGYYDLMSAAPEIPEASDKLHRHAYVYTGDTIEGGFSKGHTYICEDINGTYTWVDCTPGAMNYDIIDIVTPEEQLKMKEYSDGVL